MDYHNYQPIGDKKNSDYFQEFLQKIYKYRDENQITQNIQHIHSFHIQVDPGTAYDYIAELLLLTPYQYDKSLRLGDYNYHILKITDQNPLYIIHEPHLADNVQTKQSYHLNNLSKVGHTKAYTRYIGEVYTVQNLQEIQTKFTNQQEVYFDKTKDQTNILWTQPSTYTWNRLGYLQVNQNIFPSSSKPIKVPTKIIHQFKNSKQLQHKYKIDQYVLPIDHFATRVYSHDREHAILEYLTLTNYYFWGAYNIGDQNSSTNICRNTSSVPESISPAKVFTANNTPFYTNHITGLPSPTENFVRNYGRRLHHIAYAVKDGFIGPEEDDIKNVDFVVSQLQKCEAEFLEHVIGSCAEGLKQIFSKPSPYSLLITEYIQRCDDFQGFFTKENVAALTQAAGQDDLIT
jgi:hypothetical protein